MPHTAHLQPKAASGHITGSVTNADGAALTGIGVRVYQNQGGWWSWIASATTDGEGNYDAGNLAPGTYRIGFFDGSGAYLAEYYNDAPDVDSATDIAVTVGPTTGIDAVLSEGGHITGAIANSGGTALAGLSVTVYQNQYGYWSSVGSTTTDGSGGYDFGRPAYGHL